MRRHNSILYNKKDKTIRICAKMTLILSNYIYRIKTKRCEIKMNDAVKKVIIIKKIVVKYYTNNIINFFHIKGLVGSFCNFKFNELK